ncbi:helix-turn-helix domain-containing protein [Ovoidimarina sediminis]|uniref:helix-turn-helix domain-containing protein n=1 Tax=Ovoidimarina sediminis TaxID=3079856 RepID=UPI002910FEEE|nr:helix-turn-helix transcriptional regulator [Rhodophyticola sp. MJ-SS7]MDU8942134.1 helix-turn-helix transcriptional regulator [Rhodophyticola sp. MJ-SS7]
MKTDKRDRAARFRRRLLQAMTEAGLSQSALARSVGVDRSTISQLVSSNIVRLPNAQVVAECAATLGISADWLLGLSERPEQAAALLAESMEFSAANRALIDDQIYDWHREAAGYKIRHVPARLPDLVKTHDMLRWEYAPHLGRTIDQAIGASSDRLDLLKGSPSDYEIAIPIFELETFVRGEGYYAELPEATRKGQIERMLMLHDQLYPTLRVFLFDARRLHSAPVTVFGPLLAALYLGSNYIVFRDTERVTAISRHFDALIREASISAREFPDYLADLARGA